MESVQCGQCHRIFDDATTLLVHQQFDSCEEKIRCPICDQSFADAQLVEIHFTEVHDGSSRTTSNSIDEQLVERQKRMRKEYEEEYNNRAMTMEDEDEMIARLLQEEEEAQSFEQFQVKVDVSFHRISLRFLEPLWSEFENVPRSSEMEFRKIIEEQIHIESEVR